LEKRDWPVEKLGLKPRTLNAVRLAGVVTVGDLLDAIGQKGKRLALGPAEGGWRNFGREAWKDVLACLLSHGIPLPEPTPDREDILLEASADRLLKAILAEHSRVDQLIIAMTGRLRSRRALAMLFEEALRREEISD